MNPATQPKIFSRWRPNVVPRIKSSRRRDVILTQTLPPRTTKIPGSIRTQEERRPSAANSGGMDKEDMRDKRERDALDALLVHHGRILLEK